MFELALPGEELKSFLIGLAGLFHFGFYSGQAIPA
jgi:hypothetical protein